MGVDLISTSIKNLKFLSLKMTELWIFQILNCRPHFQRCHTPYRPRPLSATPPKCHAPVMGVNLLSTSIKNLKFVALKMTELWIFYILNYRPHFLRRHTPYRPHPLSTTPLKCHAPVTEVDLISTSIKNFKFLALKITELQIFQILNYRPHFLRCHTPYRPHPLSATPPSATPHKCHFFVIEVDLISTSI